MPLYLKYGGYFYLPTNVEKRSEKRGFMQIKTDDGYRNVSSAGVGGAGLGLGIAGTALGLMNGGFNLFNGGNNRNTQECNEETQSTRLIGALRSELAQTKAERYTDGVGIELYREIVALSNKNDDKINDNYKELAQFIAALDKQVAVDKKETECNFAFLNNRITESNKELRCYVDGKFVPGKLVMPKDSICPSVMERYNTWTAPTTPASDT